MSDHAAPDAPVTGATGDQIWKAQDDLVRSICRINANESVSSAPLWQINKCDDMVRAVAPHLVPPGFVIAPAGDVLTAEDRAAIGRLCKLHMADTVYASAVVSKRTTSEEQDASWELMNKARKAFTAEDFKRLRALAAGGQA